MQVGITETIAALDEEFANETPAAFHVTPPSPLRIFAPAHTSFGAGEVNGNYFDSYISSVGSYYANHPLSVVLFGEAREFVGNTQGTQFVFMEVNLNNGAIRGGHLHRLAADHAKRPVLQGPLATGNTVEAALEAQFCAAFNRHVMRNYAQWIEPSAYYQAASANYDAQFWHKHSIVGLSYGFAYDDVNNQSSTITTPAPEHMALGISY